MDLSVLLIIAVFAKGLDACNIRVCLTWTVKNDYLDLRCRVNHLIYAVVFYNNKRIELGYCVSPKPAPKCLSPYNNTSIYQNTKTNITYLRISGLIDSHVNGQWECKHGTNIDSAVINVTVLDSDSGRSINDKRCWQSYLAYTMIGFVCTIFISLSLLVYSHRKCIATPCFRVLNPERCNRAKPCIAVVVPLITVLLFLIPVIIGLIDNNICKDEEMYIIIGLIMAVLLSLLVAHVYMEKEKAIYSSIPTNQHQDADHIDDNTEETQSSDTAGQDQSFMAEDS